MIRNQTVRVLVVDNDAIDREVCIRYLSQIHMVRYQVSEVGNVHDALDCCKAGVCDVAVVNYMLPDGTGVDLLKALNNSRGVNVPVVILTNVGNEKHAVESIKAGAKNYIPKNKVSPKVLHEAIQEALGDSQIKRPPAPPAERYQQEEAHCAIPPQTWIRI